MSIFNRDLISFFLSLRFKCKCVESLIPLCFSFKLLLYLFDFLCFSFILFIYSHLSFHWSSESMWKLGTIKPTKLQLGRSLFVRVYFFFRGKQGRERVSTWGLAALTSTESLLRWLWAQHLLCSFCHVWSSMLDDGKSPMFVGSFFSLLYSNRIAPLTQMCSLKIHCEFATLFFAASSFEVCCFSFKSCQKQKSTRANGENVMANWMDAIIPKDGGENHENDFHGKHSSFCWMQHTRWMRTVRMSSGIYNIQTFSSILYAVSRLHRHK